MKGRSASDMLSNWDGTEITVDIRTDYASKLEEVKFYYTKFTLGYVIPICW
jgi:hypothetical protein